MNVPDRPTVNGKGHVLSSQKFVSPSAYRVYTYTALWEALISPGPSHPLRQPVGPPAVAASYRSPSLGSV